MYLYGWVNNNTNLNRFLLSMHNRCVWLASASMYNLVFQLTYVGIISVTVCAPLQVVVHQRVCSVFSLSPAKIVLPHCTENKNLYINIVRDMRSVGENSIVWWNRSLRIWTRCYITCWEVLSYQCIFFDWLSYLNMDLRHYVISRWHVTRFIVFLLI